MSQPVSSDDYLQRFAGVARLYGDAGLAALQGAHFMIIGIGGVGSWSAEALVRSGVGTLTLVDLDDVCISNSNRQIHTLNSTIGKPKTRVMAQRLLDINPQLDVRCVDDFLDEQNIDATLDAEPDVIIDAIDSALIKAALIARCKRRKQLLVSVGSAGGKRDPRQVSAIDLSRTTNDPLLAKTRNHLRRLYGFSRNARRVFSVPAIYSPEQMVYPDQNGGICQSKSHLQDGIKLDCAGGFGAVTMVTATFGFVAASCAIERYLSRSGA